MEKLLSRPGKLALSKDLLKPFILQRLKSSIVSDYDSAYDGKAVIYTHRWAETKALLGGKRKFFANTRSWAAGEGILFAQLVALLKGHMTLKEYLFGASIPKAVSTQPKSSFFKQKTQAEQKGPGDSAPGPELTSL